MFLCSVRTGTASVALIEKMSQYKLFKLKRNGIYISLDTPYLKPLRKQNKSYIRSVACKICFVLRAKSVTQ